MGKKTFLKYCTDNGIPEGETLYARINENPGGFVDALRQAWPASFANLQAETQQAKGKTA